MALFAQPLRNPTFAPHNISLKVSSVKSHSAINIADHVLLIK